MSPLLFSSPSTRFTSFSSSDSAFTRVSDSLKLFSFSLSSVFCSASEDFAISQSRRRLTTTSRSGVSFFTAESTFSPMASRSRRVSCEIWSNNTSFCLVSESKRSSFSANSSFQRSSSFFFASSFCFSSSCFFANSSFIALSSLFSFSSCFSFSFHSWVLFACFWNSAM